MAGNAPLEPPDLSQSSSQDTPTSRKRRLREVYAPSAKDQFPDVPWYNLDYQMITDMVHEMLDEIIHGVGRFAAIDSGIKGVIDAAEEAKNLPDLEKCCMAVLGEQGAGKSTLITALMGGRKLVEKSGNTKSCTAVPTVIVHKKGADDDTRLSDVTIEWMRPEEWSAHIREQMSRWTDVHPGTYLAQWNAGDATTNETGAQDEDEDKTDDEAEDESDEEVNFSDSDLEEIEEYEQPKSKPRKKKSRKLENAASTAKEFFQTIFNTDENAMARRQLDDKLYNTDIRRGDFEATCIARLTERFRRLGPQLMVRENMSEFLDVSDFDLREKRHLAKKLWPFVKVVTIATGHILLRYGMCFYDLPGFGDTNQLRAAHINKFRWKADLELIVAESARIRTNRTLNRYIADSVRMKRKAGGTIVIMNKTDTLLNLNDIEDQIFDIQEEPFPDLHARLLELTEQIEDEDNEDPSLRDRLDDLTRDVFLAYVEREAGHVKEHLESKGAAFFAASATSSLDWRDRMRRSDPWLSPEASAVPAITRHFLSLPASTNLSKYRDHVYRVLAAFRARCGRVLKKHIEDQHYARVRKDFSSQIPTLRIRLEKVVPGTVENAVALPWSKNDEPDIRKGIKSLFIEKWIHPLIFVSGWGKMLRENGIPVDGKYSGRNLNEEILHTMESRIDEWSEGMTDSAEAIAQAMYKPVQDALETVKSNLQSCTATPELTEAATEALEEMSEEVEMVYNNLQDKLQRSLDDTHLRFTTEIDVECPIAQTMKPSYKRASDPKFVLSGKGIYNRQRKVLKESMLKPKRHYTRLERGEERIKPLLQTLNEKLVSRQNEVWKEDCTSFIGETTELLETFSKTMEDLLTDAAFMKEDHRKAREELKRLLGTFDDRLEEVQNEFVNLEPQHPAKKVKVENQEEPLSATAPGTVSETGPETGSETVPETTPESAPESAPEQPGPQDPVPNTTPATTSDTDSAPISQNFGWHHFLANMHPLGSA